MSIGSAIMAGPLIGTLVAGRRIRPVIGQGPLVGALTGWWPPRRVLATVDAFGVVGPLGPRMLWWSGGAWVF